MSGRAADKFSLKIPKRQISDFLPLRETKKRIDSNVWPWTSSLPLDLLSSARNACYACTLTLSYRLLFHLLPAAVKMPVTASRAVLRQSQFLTRRSAVRHASSSSEKAKESASSAASKASQGFSRVTASAGPILSSTAQALRQAGGRTGKFIAFVDSKSYFPLSLRTVMSFLAFLEWL